MPRQNSPFKAQQRAERLKSPFEKWQESKRERSVDWGAVKPSAILVALAAATQAGATIVVGPAMGGQGICIRVWHGDDKWTEYASNAEGVMALCEAIVEHYQSTAEDIYLALGMESPFSGD